MLTKANRVAMPHLPLVIMSFNRQSAGVFIRFEYIPAAETTWPELN
jgi:hypothetical protein